MPLSRGARPNTHTTIDDIPSSGTVEETPMGAMLGIRDILNTPQPSQVERPVHTHRYLKHERLCITLFDLLPPPEVTMALVVASPGATLVSTLFHTSQEISQGRFQKLTAIAMHSFRESHPIVLAKRLLQLAICVQQLPPECNYLSLETQTSLKGAAAENVNTVMELVTSRDDLTFSPDGVECLVLLALFQLNAGNLRRSWLTVRRAVNASQLLDLRDGILTHFSTHDKTIPPGMGVSPRWLWYRVVFFDRYLSLMLGRPPGVQDNTFADFTSSNSQDTKMERLEKTQTVLTGRILERNAMNKKDNLEAFSLTQLIDGKLDTAAEEMGLEWWKLPSIKKQDLTSSSHVLLQIHHHTLKLYLHLPYLLRRESSFSSGRQGGRYDHSRASCATSARSILRLFVPYRTLHPSAAACRHVDHSALIAAMTLLLGYVADQPPHLEAGHPNPDAQRREDLQLAQSARDRLHLVAETCKDEISRDFAALIARLIPLIRSRDSGFSRRGLVGEDPERPWITFYVPYLGTIYVRPWALNSINFSIDRVMTTLSEVAPGIDSQESSYDINWPGVSSSGSARPVADPELVPKPGLSSTRQTENTLSQDAPEDILQADDDSSATSEPSASLFFDADLSSEMWPLQGIETNFWELLQQGISDDLST
ncbi:hypothetical protein ASPACDRAFT_42751 [Aspergillus aculeatus ATCC 16872]|uniref:Xylanolytic transcriptional activator regulatory domain-containing protein n=1 Tax=Aspergillus aculeatus (strain ATCC 16872 / CBS 172.66 / WB 5094) TaxID=690307 RepID=A0A1L9WVA1_ASPA1|nr:uncharacterized protein ASPACDRAFT_42751 [Aspergillus aculeatus ATCC 16872]OJK00171.1 hypothetical protein ASPACDRAFT_42751 [Aspergillus aculeatus ATCC 16872]